MATYKQNLFASDNVTTIGNNDIDKGMIPPRQDINLSRQISMTVSCTADKPNTIPKPTHYNRHKEKLHDHLQNIIIMTCVHKQKRNNNMKHIHLSSASFNFVIVNMTIVETIKHLFSRLNLILDQMEKNCYVIRADTKTKILGDKIGLTKIQVTSVYFRWMDGKNINFFGKAVTGLYLTGVDQMEISEFYINVCDLKFINNNVES